MKKKYLKFSANWCNTCKQLDKILTGIDLPIEVIDVDEDSNEKLVEKYGIKSLPTMILIDGDKEIARINGLTTIEKIKETYGS